MLKATQQLDDKVLAPKPELFTPLLHCRIPTFANFLKFCPQMCYHEMVNRKLKTNIKWWTWRRAIQNPFQEGLAAPPWREWSADVASPFRGGLSCGQPPHQAMPF